ncbi:filament-like plant protein 4 [Phtheirospermum japonicum]|uniref:Filament-like plant protein 4 n=1 Tax=Phtheirospermum japonicum TaxID=374723 RepID=A0A830C822_9LAMI|nr:filament-like plant protein 4 [Phtheirospermum japonicum]
MDKRSWPWKKKSSDKQAAAIASDSSEIGTAEVDKVKQDATKKPKYVQISMESYTHLTGLEDQVKSYEEQVQSYEEQVQSLEDEVKDLNEKLSEANTEMTNKENLVKQHAKVAEEAVSGWEKAEAEAAALKNHLESVTLLKLTAEDRASHLDGALKECMRQIRNLKEEHEQKLHEVILNKSKLFDKMKHELESKIADFNQELMRSTAENAALSRSLQERSNMLIQLSEEKSQAKAEIEILKSDIESCEKEINSLKYEVHLARKEVDIRNEEKNMSVRSAEVANKQHIEGVKKIAKLEAECQRLRGLVRKKLPGPAALAQMKLEVENLGRDYGETRLRRSPVKPPTPHSAQMTDFSLDNSQKYLKENDLLTDRLLAMEEETKMLKEALAKRNSELQASRSIYAHTASKLQSLEAQIQANGEQKSSSRSENRVGPGEGISMSEDGIDDNVSCSGSWSTGPISEKFHLKKEKSENTNNLDLMDDFLEMEKLAYLSNGSNGKVPNAGSELVNNEDVTVANPQPQTDFVRLLSKIATILESMSDKKDAEKAVEDVRRVMQDMQETLSEGKTVNNVETMISQEIQIAVTQIHEFIMILGKEAKTVPDGEGLNEKLDTFSAKYTEAVNSNINLIDFVLDTSHVLNKASELHFNVLGFNGSEVETGSSDCIDKIALPENKPIVDESLEERYSNGCARFSDSASDPDVPNDANIVPISESTANSWKCSFEEFEQLKTDKDKLEDELARCVDNFENTKTHLLETERVLAEVKEQLTSVQKSNGLAETQLKCMAESYNSLETRADELKNEVNVLQGKIESLENELEEERKCHEEALNRCKELQEQLERIECSAEADNEDKPSQETELAAAAEKLAECQETIFLLGKQLKSLRPQTDILSSPNNTRSQNAEPSVHEDPTISGTENSQDTDPSEMDTFHLHRAGSESPMDLFNIALISSDSEANNLLKSPISSKYPKHRPTKSGSSSTSSTPTPEKHGRGFSRFFSPKGKNGQ